MPDPLSVGVVGAGPWATMVHAPVLAASPHTRLAGVWARRAEAAGELAERHHTDAVGSFEELLERCDAVAFAVPPDVQVPLAIDAARAGKHLLLEKPIALDLASAERLTDAVHESGVRSLIVLSWRYASSIRTFLAEASSFDALGGRGVFASGALLGGMFATPWRLERGPLLDLGPHVVDLLDAALGRVVDVRAAGNGIDWVELVLQHESGRVSGASLCATSALQPHRAGVELYSKGGVLEIDCTTAVGPDAFATLAEELVRSIRDDEPHELDVDRGLHLQRVLSSAESQLMR